MCFMAANKDKIRKAAEKMASITLECMAAVPEAEQEKRIREFEKEVEARFALPEHLKQPLQGVALDGKL
jgi:hypothetical protein